MAVTEGFEHVITSGEVGVTKSDDGTFRDAGSAFEASSGLPATLARPSR